MLDGRPVVFGEVLYDCFPDSSRILGGAPFNVAWHLQGFGLSPLFVSRIGRDEAGERVVSAMREHEMDVAGIQIDDRLPTGKVEIELDDGQATFSILPQQAYDFIDPGQLSRIKNEAGPLSVLYHGSLAARNDRSRESMEMLRSWGLPAFIDVNLRAPWWDRPLLDSILRGAKWVKLNQDELAVVTDTEEIPNEQVPAAAARARDLYNIDTLIVTCGARGATLATPDRTWDAAAAKVERTVDTVGAGDAFSSVVIFGLVQGWPAAQLIHRAVGFAARICGIRGAIPQDRGLYREQIRLWRS